MLKHKQIIILTLAVVFSALLGAFSTQDTASALDVPYTASNDGSEAYIESSAFGGDYRLQQDIVLKPVSGSDTKYRSASTVNWTYKLTNQCSAWINLTKSGQGVGTVTAEYTSSENNTACKNSIPAAGTTSGDGGDTGTGGGTAGEEEEEEAATTCVIDGMGWFICAAAQTGARAMDGMYSLLETMLVIPKLNIDTSDSQNGMYNAWSIMRNLANLAFIIAFLIIIFSQVTSIGLSNYNIKKLAPRLIISAILVNISYWISAAAVDLSNIAGNSIYDVLQYIRTEQLGDIAIGNQWEVLISALLAGSLIGVTAGTIGVLAVIGAPVASAALWIAIPMLLGALLAVVVAIIVIAARHALVVILIIISPLAFVAFLLPNTQRMFDMWRKSLTAMLVFYPLASLVFAGAQLSSFLILQSLNDRGTESDPIAHLVILALFVQVAPLILLPKLVAVGGGVIGRLAGMVNNKNRGMIDRSKGVRNRKVALNAQEFRNAPERRRKRGPFKGRRTAVGMLQSLARNSYQGKLTDDTRSKTNENVGQSQWANSQSGQDALDKLAHTETQKTIDTNAANVRQQATLPVDLLLKAKSSKLDSDAAEAKNEQAFQEYASNIDASKLSANIAGIDPDERLQTQNSLRALNLANNATAAAKGVQQQEYASALDRNARMAQTAGGIDPNGAIKVRASAKSAISREKMDTIKNIESLVSYDDATSMSKFDPKTGALISKGRMQTLFENAQTDEERSAYANMMSAAGEPGHNTLKNALFEYEAKVGRDSPDLLNFKEYLGQNSTIRSSSKAIDNWISNAKGTDKNGQTYTLGLQEHYSNPGTWKILAPEAFAGMKMEAQQTALQFMGDEALKSIYKSQSFGRIKLPVRKVIEQRLATLNIPHGQPSAASAQTPASSANPAPTPSTPPTGYQSPASNYRVPPTQGTNPPTPPPTQP